MSSNFMTTAERAELEREQGYAAVSIPEAKRKYEFVMENGKLWVSEHGGQLKTGPFEDEDAARRWFRRELDVEL